MKTFRGMTLVEVLVVIIVGSILVAIIWQFWSSSNRDLFSLSKKRESDQQSVVPVGLLEKKWRQSVLIIELSPNRWVWQNQDQSVDTLSISQTEIKLNARVLWNDFDSAKFIAWGYKIHKVNQVTVVDSQWIQIGQDGSSNTGDNLAGVRLMEYTIYRRNGARTVRAAQGIL